MIQTKMNFNKIMNLLQKTNQMIFRNLKIIFIWSEIFKVKELNLKIIKKEGTQE